jgi:hypothetical protein
MKLSVETITPMLARHLLSCSGGNRSIKQAKIMSYARDMAAGNWKLNGETVIINDAGVLIDGHHRLKACIESDTAFQSVVVRGGDVGSEKTIDMGASRTLADVLSFQGEKNGNALVAAINAAVSIRNGRPRSANLSSTEILDFLEEHPLSREFSADGTRKSLPRVGAVICGIGIVAQHLGQSDQYQDFLSVLQTGIPAYAGCPAHALRERIMRDAAQRNKMPLHEAHRLTVVAWNKFLDGQPVTILRHGSDFQIKGWTVKDSAAQHA